MDLARKKVVDYVLLVVNVTIRFLWLECLAIKHTVVFGPSTLQFAM